MSLESSEDVTAAFAHFSPMFGCLTTRGEKIVDERGNEVLSVTAFYLSEEEKALLAKLLTAAYFVFKEVDRLACHEGRLPMIARLWRFLRRCVHALSFRFS